MKNHRLLLPAIPIATACFLLGSARIAPAFESITPDQFKALKKEIQPQPAEEKWLQIPWTTSLWAARQQAATNGKPILLWEMDGHPLGCT